jgi:hypothetical protein
VDDFWAGVIGLVAVLGTAPVWRTLAPNAWFGPPTRNLFAGLYAVASAAGWFWLFSHFDRPVSAYLLAGVYGCLAFLSFLTFFSPRATRPAQPPAAPPP